MDNHISNYLDKLKEEVESIPIDDKYDWVQIFLLKYIWEGYIIVNVVSSDSIYFEQINDILLKYNFKINPTKNKVQVDRWIYSYDRNVRDLEIELRIEGLKGLLNG